MEAFASEKEKTLKHLTAMRLKQRVKEKQQKSDREHPLPTDNRRSHRRVIKPDEVAEVRDNFVIEIEIMAVSSNGARRNSHWLTDPRK